MKIISPVEIDDSVIVYSNVPIDDYPEWEAGEYQEGDEVRVGIDVYRATTTTTDDPESGAEEDPPTWLNIGVVNRWKMFDSIINSSTTALEPYESNEFDVDLSGTLALEFDTQTYKISESQGIAVTIEPDGLFDSIAMFGIDAVWVDVTLETSLGDTVYERRVGTGGSISQSSWYNYFFESRERLTQVILDDLPRTSGSTLRVGIYGVEQPVSVAEMIVGNTVVLGESQHGSSVSIRSYSRRERDDFGNIRIVPRRFTRLANIDFGMPSRDVDFVARTLSERLDKPTVYIADEKYQSTVIYGFYRDWEVIISGPTWSEASLEIEEI